MDAPSVASEGGKEKETLSSNNLSLPDSSQLSTSSHPSSMPPPPPPLPLSSSAPQPVEPRSTQVPVPTESAEATANTSQDLFDSLRLTSILYNLPKADLEKLVSEIVHEEGFTKLVRYFPLPPSHLRFRFTSSVVMFSVSQ